MALSEAAAKMFIQPIGKSGIRMVIPMEALQEAADRIEELEAAIRKHRNEFADEAFEGEHELWAVLPETPDYETVGDKNSDTPEPALTNDHSAKGCENSSDRDVRVTDGPVPHEELSE